MVTLKIRAMLQGALLSLFVSTLCLITVTAQTQNQTPSQATPTSPNSNSSKDIKDDLLGTWELRLKRNSSSPSTYVFFTVRSSGSSVHGILETYLGTIGTCPNILVSGANFRASCDSSSGSATVEGTLAYGQMTGTFKGTRPIKGKIKFTGTHSAEEGTLAERAARTKQEAASAREQASDEVEGNSVISRYDRFRDETTVSTNVLISKPEDSRYETLGPFFSLYAAFVFSGQTKSTSPATISFGFIVKEFEGDKRIIPPRFSNPTEFIVLYDGARYKSAMTASRGRDNEGFVTDVVVDHLPTSTFVSIATAQTVEIRVGVNELKLTEGQLSALRKIAESVMH